MTTQHELAYLALQGLISCHVTLSALRQNVDPDTAYTIQKIQHDLLFDPALNFIKLGKELDVDLLTQKNRNRKPITLDLPVLPAVQAIIDASRTSDLTFLVTEHGQPFTANGFGNKMRRWCDEAGLPECTAHGLRKAGAAIAAESRRNRSSIDEHLRLADAQGSGALHAGRGAEAPRRRREE